MSDVPSNESTSDDPVSSAPAEHSPEIQDVDEGFTEDIEEPFGASRNSPYAIASFVVALAGIAPIGSSFNFFPIFAGGFFEPELVVATLFSAVVPVTTAVLAFWLAGRAELEIDGSDGRLGGVGFIKAARAVAILAVGVIVLSVLAQFAMRSVVNSGRSEFGGMVEEGVEFATPPPDFLAPPAPAQPAQPAFPAP
jgi:hypothetical protein